MVDIPLSQKKATQTKKEKEKREPSTVGPVNTYAELIDYGSRVNEPEYQMKFLQDLHKGERSEWGGRELPRQIHIAQDFLPPIYARLAALREQSVEAHDLVEAIDDLVRQFFADMFDANIEINGSNKTLMFGAKPTLITVDPNIRWGADQGTREDI